METESNVGGSDLVLALDVGNTSVSWGLFLNGTLIDRGRKLGSRFESCNVLSSITGRRAPAAFAIASVVPTLGAKLCEMAQNLWGLCPYILNSETVRGVRLNYPQPETIGADRLANAVAVVQRRWLPAIVVDLGTAVSFDVVDKDGYFIGGIIAPGLDLMRWALHERTALLPEIELETPTGVIGRSTTEAMQIGIVRGIAKLICGLTRDIIQHTGWSNVFLICTGGACGLVYPLLELPFRRCDSLTLEGIYWSWRLWSAEHESA